MATKTRRRHEFFKEQKKGYNPDAIMIPDNALALRNNCKEGRWVEGLDSLRLPINIGDDR